jgi:hypothetical protein
MTEESEREKVEESMVKEEVDTIESHLVRSLREYVLSEIYLSKLVTST